MLFSYTYPRPALTVDALVMSGTAAERQLLLVRRGKDPFKGWWALPGGFVDMEETLQTACLRELEEETGLRLPAMEQFRVFDAPDRDPRHRTISVVFYALIPEAETARGGDDAAEARWFPVSDLPRLAFDHREIVDLFLSKQGKG
ncbi:MAG: NUDIX hydrolase [Prolixibacteraceae bacterium]|jgi:8-oxo-dGTP diphosphatase|nr:NUDIX hydrolase [Prolixibacteraceae bacterium]MDI9565007.1 NUDIX hydrolase [Bacteroidota bacterium]NLT00314.1 NUDIX hydrolase [Bacteroidales bacterium]OQB81040.1 MAG: Bifunctional NMN adenylyltransferase/Nudix hydrolase [Bacteroidetes bacterium ADurb.Bin123]HNU76807.1 NUDIX hydrolase [Prolixibacteraceae bacterium]